MVFAPEDYGYYGPKRPTNVAYGKQNARRGEHPFERHARENTENFLKKPQYSKLVIMKLNM